MMDRLIDLFIDLFYHWLRDDPLLLIGTIIMLVGTVYYVLKEVITGKSYTDD